MKADIAFGQYYEGNSFLHRLDPRWKILFSIFYIVVIFLAKNIFAFALLVLSAILLIAVSRIPLRMILRGLKPLIFIIAFTAPYWSIGGLFISIWRGSLTHS